MAGVNSFFVFNGTFSHREDDTEEMLLYYYPSDLHIGRKLRNIGLAQGLINFTKTFSPDQPCEAVRTEKRVQAMIEAEPEYWIIFVRLLYSDRVVLDDVLDLWGYLV